MQLTLSKYVALPLILEASSVDVGEKPLLGDRGGGDSLKSFLSGNLRPRTRTSPPNGLHYPYEVACCCEIPCSHLASTNPNTFPGHFTRLFRITGNTFQVEVPRKKQMARDHEAILGDVICFCRELNGFILEVIIGMGCPQAARQHSQPGRALNLRIS